MNTTSAQQRPSAGVIPALLVDLDDPRATDASLVGSKAATLATLRRAGLPVPDGAVVLADSDGEAAADALIERFADAALAVRSSSVAEDLGQASYAGQYTTVLDVRGKDALIAAIAEVRSSARAAAERGYGKGGAMAVLVMPLVSAEAAGVAFSVNPMTGKDEVVIDAVPGLADALVSGAVTPQRTVIAGGVVQVQEGPAAIIEQQAVELAELARRVARTRGCAQDIEWAIEGSRLVLLQARPITALPVPIAMEVPPKQTWLREDEHFGRPLRPLEFSALVPHTDRASRQVFAEFGFPIEAMETRNIGGRPYVRMVPCGDTGKDSDKTPPAWLFGLVLRLVPPLRRRIKKAADVLAHNRAADMAETWLEGGRGQLRDRMLALVAVDRAALSDTELADHLEQVIEAEVAANLAHTRLAFVTYIQWGRLGVFCQKHLGWSDAETNLLLAGYSDASRQGGQALSELARAIAKDQHAKALLGGDGQALLAHRGPGGLALRRYLDEHGHMIVGFDMTHPTYAEDPRPLLAMVERLLTRDGVSRADLRNQAETSMLKAREQLADRPALLEQFHALLEDARRAQPLGDESEVIMLTPLALVRYIAVEARKRLADRFGHRDAVFFLTTDELADALRGKPVAADIERRMGEMRWAQANPGPRRYGPAPAPMPSLRFAPKWSVPFLETMAWTMDRLQPPEVEPTQDGAALRGIAASPGRATGPVRIIREPAEFDRVQPGDVLVCPMTWAAWSVVFPLASAIVTELGGPLSHPAILAREFGIPAVLNVAGATDVLEDGQLVTVDGTTGTIRVA